MVISQHFDSVGNTDAGEVHLVLNLRSSDLANELCNVVSPLSRAASCAHHSMFQEEDSSQRKAHDATRVRVFVTIQYVLGVVVFIE